MTTQVTKIEDCNQDTIWYEISGIDENTGYEFDGIEEVGVTQCGNIIDCDGIPCVHGDKYTSACVNALGL